MYLSSPLGPVKARVTPELLEEYVQVCFLQMQTE